MCWHSSHRQDIVSDYAKLRNRIKYEHHSWAEHTVQAVSNKMWTMEWWSVAKLKLDTPIWLCADERIGGVYIWLGWAAEGSGQQEKSGRRVTEREREMQREGLHRLQTPHWDSVALVINTHRHPTPPGLTCRSWREGGAGVSWRRWLDDGCLCI